jgi:hypothetical protein
MNVFYGLHEDLSIIPSNSKFNCSKTEKRPEKHAGFPAGWKG